MGLSVFKIIFRIIRLQTELRKFITQFHSCRTALLIFASVFLILLLHGCQKKQEIKYVPVYGHSPAVRAQQTEYIFAVHPLHNPTRFFEVYQPLIDYLNSYATDFYLKLEASRDYSTFEKKLFERKFHIALPNPYQSVRAIQHGYKIFAKMGDDDRFRGIIVVRRGSRISNIEDLRGKAISFPSSTALAAAMMPKYFLKTHGLDVEKDADCRYVGSQESSIMNVYVGNTKAGCTWPPPFESFLEEHPHLSDSLIVKWQTEPLINNGLVVRDDVPEERLHIIRTALCSLHTNQRGREILERINLSKFESISQKVYASRVNAFLQNYQKAFGSLPEVGQTK